MDSRIEAGLIQQPMSLITINSNLNKRNGPNADNLLTIRILEASERKMQLIKKLLSPEEFDSIASELRTNTKQDLRYLDEQKIAKSGQQSSGSVPVQIQDILHSEDQILDKRLSKSESNVRLTACNYNLHDTISRKREALEFFFSEADDDSVKIVQESRDLAIELRSGYYMDSSSVENNESIVRNFGFTLRDRLNGLLSYFNLSLDILSMREDEDDQELEQSEFINLSRKLNNKPYTSKRNLLKMSRRLKLENELNKVNSATKEFGRIAKERDNEEMKELEVDRNHKVIVNLNTLGHFKPIRNVSSKQFQSAELFDILDYPKSLNCLSAFKPNRVDLSSRETAMIADSRLVNVSLSSVKLTRHKLLLPEERVAVKLLDCQYKVDQVHDSLHFITGKLIEIIDQQVSKDMHHVLDEKRLKVMLEWRFKVVNCLKILQSQLTETYDEIETLRQQQNFRSTGILLRPHDVESDKKARLELFKASLNKLIKLINSGEKNADTGFNKYLEQEDSNVVTRIEEFGLQITDIKRCPKEEYQRRTSLSRWLGSLRLKFQFETKFYQECAIRTRRPNYFIGLGLSESVFSVPIQVDQPDLLMEIEVLSRRHTLIPFYQDLIATRKDNLTLSEAHPTNRKTSLKFIDKQTEMEFDFSWSVDELISNKVRFNYGTRQLVDAIYRRTFITCHSFDDIHTKLFKLFNRVDPRYLLLYLFNNSNELNLLSSSFTLNPYSVHFTDQERDDASKRSVRQILLTWRWLNNINQTVYLSDRENNKYHDLNRLEEIDSKLRQISTAKLESGYKAIEQMRLWALDYIKKYESHLNEILQLNNGILSQQQSATNLRDLLQEPRIKIDLSGLVNLKLGIIPKRTARRPLMPKRSKKGNLNKNFQQEIIQDNVDESKTVDLENQVFDQWQRFTSRMRLAHKLQLVVTIQQANNLPMRVIQQHSSATRSNTPQPFSSTPTATGPPASPSNFFNLVSSQLALNANIGGQTTLLPPTTYVEVVFQRKQQASSLAHGKNPIWHETLFFPVDVPKLNYLTNQSSLNFHSDGEDSNAQKSNTTNEGGNVRAQCQLVDEYLQLNLYDYNCYIQSDIVNSNQQNEMPTLPLISRGATEYVNLGVADSTMQSNRMLASRQRIERYLLGSLRVPLRTLLSTGRIEGSFALNQPLFMENYQFEPEQASVSSILSTQQQQDSSFKRNNKFETYISLFITLDPPISIPFYLYLSTGSHESEQVFRFAKLWERTVSQYRKRASKQSSSNSLQGGSASNSAPYYHIRHVRAIVLQRDAKYCLVSRLITPLRPPKELIEDANKSKLNQMKSLARFVSLLSPLKYGLFNMRLLASSLWFDSAQLINKYLGGSEEKAVLLCNYFLYLGQCSAVLLGDAIPEGRCAYVIVWHEQSRKIDEQLQLNADNLLESLGGVASSNKESNSQVGDHRLVEQENFLLKLPILINPKTVQLWDPNSGKSYTLNDSLQLISVGSIVTCENVYANIQATESVSSTNFDIRLRNLWFPLFEGSSNLNSKLGDNLRRSYLKRTNQTNNIRRQLVELEETRRLIGRVAIKPILRNEFVQLNYEKLTEDHCKQLEDAIDRTIKAQLLKWRSSRPTYFNRTLSRLLSEKLKLFEEYSIEALTDNSSGQPVDWRSELAELIRNEILLPHISSNGLNARQVVSWPMNLPYTSMKTILDSLFASGVHNADVMLESAGWNLNSVPVSAHSQSPSCNTQFLVASHAHAYPARVVSVWLYVAAVVTQNRPFIT